MPARKAQKSIIQRIADNVIGTYGSTRNSLGNSNGVPLFNGPTRVFDQSSGVGDVVHLRDDQLYLGYLFAAVSKRARRVSALTEHLETRDRATGDITDELNHPYIELIDSSPSFSNYFFWCAMSTFLDLKGEAYLLAIRNFTTGANPKYGTIKELKIINPFKLQRAINNKGEMGGWIEWGPNGSWRTIPDQQMIHIKTLNPFDLSKGFAMVDAARNEQHLNQQTAAYTRNAIKQNVGQRGLLTTDVILEDEDFANFKNAVEASSGISGAGKFLYGNGPGSIAYTDMQIDLEKLALTAINEVSREGLFAVAGVSKTVLGIEMSGVTRESGKVQSDLFDANETMPQLQTIIDALNQDYRNKYSTEKDYKDVEIYIDSPLKKDRDAEKADAETLKIKAESAATLVKAGYDPAAALEAVGLDEMDWYGIPTGPTTGLSPDGEQNAQQRLRHAHDEADTHVQYLDDKLKPIILGKQTSFENEVVNIERNLLTDFIGTIQKSTAKNDLTKKQKDERTKELAEAIATFFASMIALFGQQTIKARLKDFGLTATFTMTPTIERMIKAHAKRSAVSHVNTVLEEIYQIAYDAANKGLGRDETIRNLQQRFTDNISKERAKRVARTEANRAISESQYQADKQFLDQNGLTAQAYKRWITRSENPCPFCIQQQETTAANPIPFNSPFLKIGESVEATFESGEDSTTQRTYVVGYEPIVSGTLHPNCSCIYELIIKT